MFVSRVNLLRGLPLALLVLGATACRVGILHDVSEDEANAVLAALQKGGIDARKQRASDSSEATYTVSVREADAPTAWRLMRQHNLPPARHPGLGDVFGDVGLVPTSTQEQALLRHALSGEVARTLLSVSGVHHARVHLVLAKRNPLAPSDRADPQPRAAVLLRVDPDSPLTVDDVRKLVAGGVQGLDKSAVNVVMHRAALGKPARAEPLAVASVGPFRVASASHGPLLATLVAMIVLLLLLALAALLLFRQTRVLTHRNTRASTPPAARRSTDPRLVEHSLRSLSRSAAPPPQTQQHRVGPPHQR